jgi:aspartate carbamoyltransferase catalytic subunit
MTSRSGKKKAPSADQDKFRQSARDPQLFAALNSPHLLGIEGMSRPVIEGLLERANQFAELPKNETLAHLGGMTVFTIFFENSTRTRVSFDLAVRKIGATGVNVPVATSSIKKGESLLDTAVTLNAMHPDILVMRHQNSGASLLLSGHVDAAVVNAGDGRHEHPTQALLDALTIKRRLGEIAGLKIAICGDITNSRVARSNIHLLSTLGAKIRLVSPSTLLPKGIEQMGVETYHDMMEGIHGVDIVMLLRLQTERMQGTETPSQREFFHLFGLNAEKLTMAAPNALIMHPGPMNRGVEIDSALADDHERSLITMQVDMGVAVRMACLEAVAGMRRRNNEARS